MHGMNNMGSAINLAKIELLDANIHLTGHSNRLSEITRDRWRPAPLRPAPRVAVIA
jgi:hypothetical protein